MNSKYNIVCLWRIYWKAKAHTSFVAYLKVFKNDLYLSLNINLLLTKRKGHTGEYWPKVVAVLTEPSKVHTKTTEGHYSPVRLKLAMLVSSLLYGTRAMLVLNLPAFENKKIHSQWLFP